MIIVTSDHGEEFGEHGMTRHGFEVWDTLVHVPLMILHPAGKPRRIDALRSAIDLAPTILDAFGIAAPSSFEGKSLLPEVLGGPSDERDVVVDLPATSDNGRRRALLRGTEKLICFDTDSYCKLYDLATDPLEKSPQTKGPEYLAMKERYVSLAKSIADVAPYACAADCLNAAYRKKQEGN
jgi:arylsulfatase A-like enzyme